MVIILLLSFLTLNLSGVVFSPAVPVDPSYYTFDTFVGDKRTYSYTNILSLHPNGSKLKTMSFQLPFGGFLRNITLIPGDKVEAEITDINSTMITFVDTFILQNGSEFTPDPFYQRIDEFRIGFDVAIMTTNTTLIDAALSQTHVDAYYLDDSYMHFENESENFGDSNMSIQSSYYRATGWMASIRVENYNSTHEFSSYDLSIETIDKKNIHAVIDPTHFTVGNLQAGDVRTYFINKYLGSEYEGKFLYLTLDAIYSDSFEFSQILYSLDGTIIQSYSGGMIDRTSLHFPPSILMTTNTTLIDEVLSDSDWKITYLDDVVEFEITVETPDLAQKEYHHCCYDLTDSWLISMHQVVYNTSDGEAIKAEIEYVIFDPVHISMPVNPAHYTVGDIQTGDQKTYEFIKYHDPNSLYGGEDYASGDLTNLTITNINKTTIEYKQMIFKSTGEVIDILGEFSIDRRRIQQPHSVFMTTNSTLINEVFSHSAWEIIYSGGFVGFELELERPELQLKEYYNFTYDLKSGWIERYYTKIVNTYDGTIVYEIDAMPFKEPEKPLETTIPSETMTTSSQPSSSESSAPEIEITSLPGLFTFVALVSTVIIIRKRKLL
ncbi:MAG: hypothetical protein ACFFAE_15920 [Candidatus Hodarchaeota archaeon]